MLLSTSPGRLAAWSGGDAGRTWLPLLAAGAWLLPLLVAPLAWRHGRSRLVHLALVQSGLAWAITQAPWFSWTQEPSATSLALVLPLLVGLLAATRELPLLSWRGLVRTGWLVGALLLVGSVLGDHPRLALLGLSEGGLALARLDPLVALSWTALALGGLAALRALTHRRRPEAEAGPTLVLTMLAGWCALAVPAIAPEGTWAVGSQLFLLSGTWALGFGLHDLSWRRSHLDPLTGLLSRQGLEEGLAQLGRRHAIAVVDLDHFKKVNDRHGHEAGDRVLQAVAGVLRGCPRGRAYRAGGEEFVLLFPGLDVEQALPLVEQLRGEVKALRVAIPRLPGRKRQPAPLKVSFSAGLASGTGRPDGPAVLAAADEALLRAKRAGRDQVALERRSKPRRRERKTA
ncbi:MAG: GGDEF domain-containing protein [Acidobacteriota bacterium]